MILATLRDASPDGRLVVVAPSYDRMAFAPVATLQQALERWEELAPILAAITEFPEPLDQARLAAPLPRSWQWLDGSAFATHGELMQIAFKLPPIESHRPLMYQGMSDRFYGPLDDIPLPDEADGIDFEGEFGVMVDAVPMGTSAEDALRHIRLIVQINDWSLRAIAPLEMKTGFGWVQAKPACSMAPFAVTPGRLGPAWREGRLDCDLLIDLNGRRFGSANGAQMDFGFPELVAHAARTRDLVAGTIIGSGTVSNRNYADVGSSCISERRAIEIIAGGSPSTPFLAFGDTVRMEARTPDGSAPFGVIEQKVVRAR
ncbi:MAG: fumarylacetoacetate hydrolase family protein [Novosphingobium sp.]